MIQRDVFLAAAEALDRLQAEGGVDLEQAAELLILTALAQIAVHQREINHERLIEYLANGMSLDGPGLPSPIGDVSEGDRMFEHLSAHIDQIAQASSDAYADQPYAASLATWMEGERRRNRFKAWAMTHPTCAEN
jgi:hypothetical protein